MALKRLDSVQSKIITVLKRIDSSSQCLEEEIDSMDIANSVSDFDNTYEVRASSFFLYYFRQSNELL